MKFTKKLNYLSNQWYNDGLKKANIRDLSGAIASLKKSLQYNRDNIMARNLLGLCYYGRGEIVEALVEWVISKNIKTHGNIANYYIKKVQESQAELEVLNQAIKRYNQALLYCQQGGEDLAAIQLKKVIAAHPTFVRAYQLLALIFIQTEQYAKARQLLRKAHKLDTTNEITLRYMHELKELHKDKSAKLREEKGHTVSYKLGNETIIQPVSSTLKDNATLMTILNIVIGLIVGAAVMWFLVVPSLKQDIATKHNLEIIGYSERIAALESELSTIEKNLSIYEEQSEATEQAKILAEGTKTNYEALITIMEKYYAGNYDVSALADEIVALETGALGETGKLVYDSLSKTVVETACKTLYEEAKVKYEATAIKTAIGKLERVIEIDEDYADGQAMLLLMRAYKVQGETDKANQMYQRIVELLPGTAAATEAATVMGGGTTE